MSQKRYINRIIAPHSIANTLTATLYLPPRDHFADLKLQQWNERYDWMFTRNDEYYLLCIEDNNSKIVGTGALLVERKFIHNLGLVGHIEDIAVAKDQQGKKLGLRIIQALDYVAEQVGCYKV